MDESARRAAQDGLIEEIALQGISSRLVLDALRRVPRHRFVPAGLRHRAYDNVPLPIGQGQTISQPFVVALMTQLAQVTPLDRVLVVGTGSGYQDAVMAELAGQVYSVERLPELAHRASDTLRELGYRNIHLRVGDGYEGWQEEAPFAAILVTAAPPAVPPALIDQLALGGRLVIPVGEAQQQLRVMVKTASGVAETEVVPVQFVPLVRGRAVTRVV
ncbi:MAG: protein-L-isoaspartate(D-aspartate) O-methyltransferase [Myxococcales bacterium]|nr:protein-L-isoaspartate(D-aspartate) O-methyltransferase [Myxococcales bacterium]